jgi:hypothetical protein
VSKRERNSVQTGTEQCPPWTPELLELLIGLLRENSSGRLTPPGCVLPEELKRTPGCFPTQARQLSGQTGDYSGSRSVQELMRSISANPESSLQASQGVANFLQGNPRAIDAQKAIMDRALGAYDKAKGTDDELQALENLARARHELADSLVKLRDINLKQADEMQSLIGATSHLTPAMQRVILGMETSGVTLTGGSQAVLAAAAFAQLQQQGDRNVKFGPTDGMMSGRDIVSSRNARPGDLDNDAAQMTKLSAMMKGQSGGVAAALAAVNENFSKDTLATYDKQKQTLEQMGELYDVLAKKVDYVGTAWKEFGSSVRDSVSSSIGQALGDILTHTGKVGDAFKSLANSIVHTWSDMMGKLLMQNLVGNLFQQQSNGSMGAGGGLFGAALGSLFGAGGSAAATTVAAANGGVFSGGISFFSAGGIARTPTLGMVGERGDGVPEGIIPLLGRGHTIPLGTDAGGLHAILPGGRSIRATMYANGGIAPGGIDLGAQHMVGAVDVVGQQAAQDERNMNFYVVANSDEAVAKGMRRNRDLMIDTVTSEVRGGRKLGRAIRRLPNR